MSYRWPFWNCQPSEIVHNWPVKCSRDKVAKTETNMSVFCCLLFGEVSKVKSYFAGAGVNCTGNRQAGSSHTPVLFLTERDAGRMERCWVESE